MVTILIVFTGNVRFVSCNIRGSRNLSTFVNRHVYGIGVKQPALIFLQELKLNRSHKQMLLSFFPNYNVYVSFLPNGSSSRGVCIAVHKQCNFKRYRLYDGDGNYLLLACQINDIKCLLGNIYLPKGECRSVITALGTHLDDLVGKFRIILGGDFNVSLKEIDTTGLYLKNKANMISTWLNKYRLLDIWRIQHPNVSEFTCVTKTPTQCVLSRLDCFFISDDSVHIAQECSIGISGGADHDAVYFTINCQVETKSIFRFPASLLKDGCFRNLLIFNINTLVQDNQEASARTLWEIIKCCIRSTAACYTYDRKKSREDRITEIDNRMTKLKSAVAEGACLNCFTEIDMLLGLRDSLFRDEEYSRMLNNWKDAYGNRGVSDKKFFNKIQDSAVHVGVCQLRDEFDEVQSSKEDILRISRDFYDDSYRFGPTLPCDSPADLIVPRISQEMSDFVDEQFTMNDLKEALDGLRLGKAPGNDGLTVEFHKAYWDIVGNYLHSAILESVEIGEMGSSLKQGLVTLIPKKGRDLLDVSNWRGICLLNVDYKVFTRAITDRVGVVLPQIIHADQKAFVPGRYISNAIYDLYAVQQIVDDNDDDVLIESLDIYKAFDSVSWEFLQHCYSLFGFSDRFVGLLKCIYKNRVGYIVNNGFLSAPIKIGRGCPQGDPLSPANFIVAIEILACRIRYNSLIKPISILDVEKKLNLVADDVLLMYHNSAEASRAISWELTKFHHNSGLMVNNQKCAVMRIGRNKNLPLSVNRRRNIPRRQDGFKYIGVQYHMNHSHMMRCTYLDKLAHIRDAINSRSRSLSAEPILSKVYGLNSLYFSRVRYLLNVLPLMSLDIVQKYQGEFQYAIWGDNRHKLNVQLTGLPVRKGGLGGMDIQVTMEAYKIYAVQYIFKKADEDPQFWQYQLASSLAIDIEDLVKGNMTWKIFPRLLSRGQGIPLFWRDSLQTWCNFHHANYCSERFDLQEVFSRPIYLNSMLGSTKFYKSCNIVQHKQCLEESGLFTVNNFIHIDWDTIPKRKSVNSVNCVSHQILKHFRQGIPNKYNNVCIPYGYKSFASRIIEQKVTLKEISGLLQVKTVKSIFLRWGKRDVVVNHDIWNKLCSHLYLFLDK